MAVLQYGGIIEQVASTATAGSTTTLTNTSAQIQVFTGSANQTIVLPNATTFTEPGAKFEIYNSSTGTLTVNANGGALLNTISPNTSLILKLASNGSSAGTWVQQASSTGSAGTKNYLSSYTASTGSGAANSGNGNFELGSTAGWSLGHVSALTNGFPSNTSPTFGSGANVNLSFAVSSFTPLAGSYDGQYVSTTATTAGDFLASNAFFIDTEDQAKPMQITFYYSAASGASNGNFSGTSSNSFGVAIWDVTNSAWIQPAGCFGMTQSSGAGLCTATFQTTSNSTQYRLVLYNATATSGAITLYVDDFVIGPVKAPIGVPASDWIAYTPTWTATSANPAIGNGSINAYWRRNGKNMQINWQVLSGTTTTYGTGNYIFGMPSGFTIDTTTPGGVPVNSSLATYGTANARVTATLNSSVGTVISGAGGPGTVQVETNGAANTVWGSTSPGTWAATTANQTIDLLFEVPIAGWSSNVQMSSDTDTRVVAYYSVGQIVPGGSPSSGTGPMIGGIAKFGTTAQDTHSAYNTSTGFYTVPVSGFYVVNCMLEIHATATSNDTYGAVGVFKNSLLVMDQFMVIDNTGDTNIVPTVNVVVLCNAGDTLAVCGGSDNTSPTYSNNLSGSYLSINRLSGPSVIASTESVNAVYTDVSGQAIGSSTGVFKFSTKVRDTHSAYNTSTGIYTVPVSGVYRVSAAMQAASTALTTAEAIENFIIYNGSTTVASGLTWGNGVTHAQPVLVTASYPCNAGDTLQIQIISNVATTGSTTAGTNTLSIERIGN
jgi:hypothetical protein